MEHFSHIREFIQPNYFLIGIDLKDQFLSVGINQRFRKFLKFSWLEKLYQWCVLPFGLRCSPRIVTKLLKPVMSFLRTAWGVLISVYMDDMLLMGKTADEVYFNAQLTILVLMSLGWEVNWLKSSLTPSHTITHLGFDINTVSMTASCPQKKMERLRDFAASLLKDGFLTVHQGEKILGQMESVRPVTPFAALHYRALQKQILKAKFPVRIPSKIIFLTQHSKMNLHWWAKDSGFPSNCTANLREPTLTIHIWSDASMEGSGSHTSRGQFQQRTWTEEELSEDPSINLLELRAAKEAVERFAVPGDLVRLHVDSRVAASYLRKQGGTRSDVLSREACLLWDTLESREIFLLTPHWVSTSENTRADFLTRHSMRTWEIQLLPEMFRFVLAHFQVSPTLDAFATRENRQVERYMSWYHDDEAVGQDALLCPWDEMTWLFPPVPLLAKVVNKVKRERISAILICPHWPSSLWWLQVKELVVRPGLPLPNFRRITRSTVGGEVQVYLDPLEALLISRKV